MAYFNTIGPKLLIFPGSVATVAWATVLYCHENVLWLQAREPVLFSLITDGNDSMQ